MAILQLPRGKTGNQQKGIEGFERRERVKVTIVGGSGTVGSSTAFRLAQDGKVDEIVLFDVRGRLAEAHALDIEQAVVYRATTRVRAGGLDETAGSHVVFVTASVPKRDAELSRREYLGVNLPLVLDTIRPMVCLSPSALWIVVSSPVDPLVYLVREHFSLPRDKVIGLNRNDTSRFRWALARTLGVPSPTVEAFVLGEHGETQVPIFSSIRVEGHPVSLDDGQKTRVKAEMDGFFTKWNQLQTGRTAGWTSAESVGDILLSMILDDGRVWPCSTTLAGEYGLNGVSLGVPLRLSEGKVKEIVKLALDPDEREGLMASANAIREMIRQGQGILGKAGK
jgi:malate dehydrogenase